MHHRIRLIAFLILSGSFILTNANAQYENHIKIPEKKYTSLMGSLQSNLKISSIKTDGVNRVWFATTNGITALAADSSLNPDFPSTFFRVAQFFPIKTKDKLLNNNISSLAFGSNASEEYFFVSFQELRTVQYGRILSTAGISFEGELEPTSLTADDNIFNVSSGGDQYVWIATSKGLRLWDISGDSPTENTIKYKTGDSVSKVQANDNKQAAFAVSESDEDTLFIATVGLKTLKELDLDTGTIKPSILDLAFDNERNLWVLAADLNDNEVDQLFIRMYSAAKATGSDDGVFPDYKKDSFPGLDYSKLVSGFSIDNSIDVGGVAGAIWLATDNGAWYAEISNADKSLGDFEQYVDPDTGKSALTSDEVDAVHVDRAGNIWFATDTGVEGALLRTLAVNNSKFIGFGATAVLTVIDINKAEDGSEGEITVSAEAGAKTSLTIKEKGDTGIFVGSFKFTESDSANAIKVTSSADATNIKFIYNYDEADQNKKLTAEASWANEVDFEDDFLIGGPCFLKAFNF